MSDNTENDMVGEWVKVKGDNGYVYDMFIGCSPELPEIEEMIYPPTPRLKR